MSTLEQRPDFHMMALAKSGSAKEYGELTVVLLGYVTKLLEETYSTAKREALGEVDAIVLNIFGNYKEEYKLWKEVINQEIADGK